LNMLPKSMSYIIKRGWLGQTITYFTCIGLIFIKEIETVEVLYERL